MNGWQTEKDLCKHIGETYQCFLRDGRPKDIGAGGGKDARANKADPDCRTCGQTAGGDPAVGADCTAGW